MDDSCRWNQVKPLELFSEAAGLQHPSQKPASPLALTAALPLPRAFLSLWRKNLSPGGHRDDACRFRSPAWTGDGQPPAWGGKIPQAHARAPLHEQRPTWSPSPAKCASALWWALKMPLVGARWVGRACGDSPGTGPSRACCCLAAAARPAHLCRV